MQDTIPNEKTDIFKIMNEVADALEIKAKNNKMEIHTFSEDEIPEIVADRNQVKQLIQNLTDNAIKYGSQNNDIMIKLEKVDVIPQTQNIKTHKGPAVAISINNKGPKISDDNLARLTERFYRMQEHKDKNIKGTGLGLSIAKQIVIRHRGNITVKSNAYTGTTFTIYLPISYEE